MTPEIVYAAIFGMLSTLVGGGVTYLFSFSRDQRLKKDEMKVLYSSLISDLRGIQAGFARDETYLPRFSSMNVFSIKGGHLIAPANISLALESLTQDLARIEDITQEDRAFNLAVASTGNQHLAYENSLSIAER